jgi:hypothetical protein
MCIIQDSDEDKAREIAQMQKIFSSARVVIAATSASACTEGFLHDRRSLIPTFNLEAKFPNGEWGTVTIFPKEEPGYGEPLTRRAWTFQECALAPRILSYGTRQARFFCLQRPYAGSADGGVVPLAYRKDTGFVHATQAHRYTPRLSRKPDDALPEAWLNYCEQYSNRGLTLSGDKLIALSAVAEYMAEQKLDGAYYAGLWECRFLGQLLWAMETETIQARPKDYRAPSWSWASVDGRPSWRDVPDLKHKRKPKYPCRVEQISVTPASSEAPFAAVSSAFMRITGECRDAIWRKSTKELLNVDDRRPIVLNTSTHDPLETDYQLLPDATDEFEGDKLVWLLKIHGPNSCSALTRSALLQKLGVAEPFTGLQMLILVLREDGNYSRVGLFKTHFGVTYKLSGLKKKTVTIV